jgi:hypothetical protein
MANSASSLLKCAAATGMGDEAETEQSRLQILGDETRPLAGGVAVDAGLRG